jgi:hypothetical protein
MKVLMKIGSPLRLFRVELSQPASIVRVRRLVGMGKYSQAMVTALSSEGSIEELTGTKVPGLHADLVLTEESAHWDLCGIKN